MKSFRLCPLIHDINSEWGQSREGDIPGPSCPMRLFTVRVVYYTSESWICNSDYSTLHDTTSSVIQMQVSSQGLRADTQESDTRVVHVWSVREREWVDFVVWGVFVHVKSCAESQFCD